MMCFRNSHGTWPVLLLLAAAFVATGCGSDHPTSPPEDTAHSMQLLQIVGGIGTFAYFQLLWPQVEVAQADNPAFATIEPSSSGFLIPGDSNGNKEWFATSFAPWIDAGGTPYPNMEVSAFLSGYNETHARVVTSNQMLLSGTGLIAGITAYQAAHDSVASPLVVVGYPSPFIGTGPDGPALEYAADPNEMVLLYQSTAGVDLTPTAAELELFDIANAPTAWLAEFGRHMIVAAKAFRSGLSNTIVITLPGLDPHDAFANIQATMNILRSLQTTLNGFYALLAAESRADRVMIAMLGDTPKNPLQRSSWPDGTPGNCNWIYVVGKGYLEHGWFGRVHANGSVSGYDPTTGADDPNRSSASSAPMTAAAIGYAATRGDASYVEDVLGGNALSQYVGVVNTGVGSMGQ